MSDTVEVSAAELAEFKQAHALLKSLYGDKKAGIPFRKMVKEKFPNASIPELDIIEEAASRTSGVEKKLDDFLAAQAKEKEDAKVAAFADRVEKIARDRGYTKEGTDKLLGIMKDRGIANPEDAVVIFEAGQPKADAKPRNFSTRMEFIKSDGKDDEKFKQLMEDPDQYMADELQAALHETAKQGE